ncbi:MAG: CBS domain-containing protein [Methanobacteriota archaeon]|nr:MAG: CBS domain-containing protein [Euryarchaeota archaeon]
MELKDIEEVKAVDLMSAKPVIASPDEILSEVIGRMKKKDVHEVLVVRDGEFLGLVSYDFLIRRRGLPPTTKVAHVLTHVTHIEDQTPVPQIAETMLSTGVRALPVKKGDRLVGVVSRTDLVRSILKFEELADLAADSVMSHSVQCVYENDTVSRARHLIQELEARTIPVIDQYEHLVGVIGLKDIAPLVIQTSKKGEDAGLESGPLDVEVKNIMSTPPISVTKDATVSKIAKLMEKHDVSNLAVVDKNVPIGIVTQIDLVELLIRYRTGEEVFVQIT